MCITTERSECRSDQAFFYGSARQDHRKPPRQVGWQILVQGDGGGGSCCDAPPEAHAAPTWVSYLDDIARAHHRTFQPRAESDDFRFRLLGIQQPLAHPVGLPARGAAHGHHIGLHHAVARDARDVLNVFHLLSVKILRIDPADQGHRVPGFGRRALVGELTVDDVGSGELVDRVLGRILRDGDGPTRPIGHAPEDRSHVLHHLVGLLAGLQVQVAGEARLVPTQAIRHQFITVTGHPVQRPLVNLRLRDEMPQAIAGVGDQIVKAPGRVVRPGHLEGAVPDTRV